MCYHICSYHPLSIRFKSWISLPSHIYYEGLGRGQYRAVEYFPPQSVVYDKCGQLASIKISANVSTTIKQAPSLMHGCQWGIVWYILFFLFFFKQRKNQYEYHCQSDKYFHLVPPWLLACFKFTTVEHQQFCLSLSNICVAPHVTFQFVLLHGNSQTQLLNRIPWKKAEQPATCELPDIFGQQRQNWRGFTVGSWGDITGYRKRWHCTALKLACCQNKEEH